MATFKKDQEDDPSERFVLIVSRCDDEAVLGQLYTNGALGFLPTTGEGSGVLPVLEAIGRAEHEAGEKGFVYVRDPLDLWQLDWPDLD